MNGATPLSSIGVAIDDCKMITLSKLFPYEQKTHIELETFLGDMIKELTALREVIHVFPDHIIWNL
jgi:hypothetical protein